MPNSMLKGSVKYSLGNKWFFIYVLVQFMIFETITHVVGGLMESTSLIVLLIVLGYGLKITHDVINGGKSLPKIKLNELINFGLKGTVVYTFYLTIQVSVLGLISILFDFPIFELEEFILNISETIALLHEHNPINFIIFLLLGLITVYVTIFFMEIALAILADGGKLKESFNFSKIRDIISTIGWNHYAIDYTKIVLAVVILISIRDLFDFNVLLSFVVSVITDILAFVVEYRGIGNIYREYLMR